MIEALTRPEGSGAVGSGGHPGHGHHGHVPFRNSVLTRLLQESIGGNCKTTLICCASPADADRTETLSTLRFAARAKLVRNHATTTRHAHLDENAAVLQQQAVLGAAKKGDGAHLLLVAARLMQLYFQMHTLRSRLEGALAARGGSRGGAEP